MKLNVDDKQLIAESEPLVSIVVPVYKVEHYLDGCILSLINQTEKNIEIILVDDGSPDACSQICDKWAGADSRIKVLHQANQGVTKARSNGVRNASGKWVLFVDGDDVIPANSVAKMLEASANVDIVVGQVKFIGPYKWPYISQNKDYSREGYILEFLKRKIHGGPVAKLFRKKLFDELVFDIPPKIKCGEDLIMNLRLADRVRFVRMIDECVYHYVFRETSAVTADPFVSLRYTVFFNRLISRSVKKTSSEMRFAMWENLLLRIFDCMKSKIKRLLSK